MHTDAVLDLMKDVAAEVITPRFRSLSSGEVHEKGPGDLVTVADHESERILTEQLQGAYPDALIVGEEATAADPGLLPRMRQADHVWLVDPVDGTRNFVHGSPDHAVMVAETRAGVTVRAWIWQPQHELAYVAELGAGVTRNGEALPQLVVADDPARWRLRTSAPKRIGEQVAGSAPMELTWLSCGIDYPKLAEGACEALLYRSTRAWDHVPGALMVSELGGVVGSTKGEVYHPRSDPSRLLATASERVFERLVQEP